MVYIPNLKLYLSGIVYNLHIAPAICILFAETYASCTAMHAFDKLMQKMHLLELTRIPRMFLRNI